MQYRRKNRILIVDSVPIAEVPPSKGSGNATKLKAGLSRPSESISTPTLRLLRSDCVLGSLGDAELHHGLCLDLDGFAGLRIASDAGLAVRFHQPAEAGHDKHAVFL